MTKQTQYLDELSNQIISLMEEHGANWKQPWVENAKYPRNISTKNWYQGINVINLMISQYRNGFGSSEWGTFKQWNSAGCLIKAGEKSKAMSVFYKQTIVEDDNGKERAFPFMNVVPIFNADQVEGYTPDTTETDRPFNDYVNVERFISSANPNINNNASLAAYNPARDEILMPPKSAFVDQGEATAEQHYYSTFLHELVHWTGSAKRCDRKVIFDKAREEYAQEELVAEFGSAMLCAMLNVTTTPMDDHAKYLNYWVKFISNNKKALKKAITDAQKAVQYLDGQQASSVLPTQIAAE